MTLIDLVCPSGHFTYDAVVDCVCSRPLCAHPLGTSQCGLVTKRAWLSAPSITPGGTRAERNTDRKVAPPVNKKKIAEDTTFEIEQKWARYSDPVVAEQHVSREINEAAGIADAAGNEKPIPKPDPIMFNKPTLAECAK